MDAQPEPAQPILPLPATTLATTLAQPPLVDNSMQAAAAAAYLKLARTPNGEFIYPDGPSVLYAAGLYLDRNENGNSAEVAAEPSALTGSPPHVVSPDQLQNSLSTASFKLAPDSEGSDIGVDHTIDNTLHHLVQHAAHVQAQAQVHQEQQETTGAMRRAPATRRRSKPYDSSSADGLSPGNGRSKSATAMARLAEGATKAMEELEDELAVKRRRNTEAARRSRERKAIRMQTLENQVAQLEALNSSMSLKLAVVEKERAIFAAREAELNRRIAALEASLREAHEALMARAIGSAAGLEGAKEGGTTLIADAEGVGVPPSDTAAEAVVAELVETVKGEA